MELPTVQDKRGNLVRNCAMRNSVFAAHQLLLGLSDEGRGEGSHVWGK